MKTKRLKLSCNQIAALALALLLPGNASAVVEIYNTVTNFNWLCPAGVTSLQVECWGGGGGGGGAFVDGGTANAGGGGGGGGAYARLDAVPVTAGNTYAITIPAAVTPPLSGYTNNQRYDGAAVSFTGDTSVTVTAEGGQGGQCKIVTGGSAASGQPGVGGAAGTGLDGAWAGGDSTYWSGGNAGGGGGGAGDLAAGGSPAAANLSFGAGGAGSDADHTGGDGGAAKNGAGSGNSGAKPGGGGGGGKATPTNVGPRKGGNGGLGQIILTYTVAGVDVVKDNNTLDLNLTNSWVGAVVPTATDVAVWDNTVTTANTTVLGADLTFSGIKILDPNGLVTINAGNTLTLGNAALNIDLSAATADLTLNCDLALGGPNAWDVGVGRTLTMGGAVSGPYAVTKQGLGTSVISGTNTYSGDTTTSAGTLQLGASEVIPNGSGNGNVVVDGTLDLNTFSETINGLSGSGTVDTVAGGTPMLTVGGNNQSSTFNGVIQNTAGLLSLSKTGSGTLVLGAANTYGGETIVRGGTLAFTDVAPFNNTSGITLSNGTTLRPDVDGAVISAPVTIASGTVTIDAPSIAGGGGTTPVPVTYNGAMGGDGGVIFKGVETANAYGTVILNGQSTYAGDTKLDTTTSSANTQIFVRLGTNNALPATTVLTLDGGLGTGSGRLAYLDLNGFDQTLAGLENVTRAMRNQRIINSGGACTLTISNTAPASSTFLSTPAITNNANINGTDLSLTKQGAGTQIITGVNNYTGDTTVSGGKLQWVVGGSSANSTVILDAVAATNSVAITDNTKTWTCANLTNNAAGVLEFDFGAVLPSVSVSPLTVTGQADFTSATPAVSVVVSAPLPSGTYPLMTWGSTLGTAPATANLTVSMLAPGTSASLNVSGNTLNLVVTGLDSIVKDDNTTDLNVGTSWVGGVVPASTNLATWDATVTSANTTVLGGNLNWGGIAIRNPVGLVTIDAGNTLTLGGAGINMAAATADLTLNCDLNVANTNNWIVDGARTLTLAGQVSGSFPVTKSGAGTAILSASNPYSGMMTVGGGTLAFTDVAALGTASGISLADGTKLRPDVDGASISAPITIGSLNTDTATINASTIAVGPGVVSTLTLNGAIVGPGNVVFNSTVNQNAASTVVLNQPGTYAGSTLLDTVGGTTASQIFVNLGTNNALPPTTVLTMDGQTGTGSGRFTVLNLNGFDQTLAGLTNVTRTLRDQRIINNAATASTLTVSNGADWTFSGKVGWGGTGNANGDNLALTKSGSGVLNLTGNNAYTGNTTVNGGTLELLLAKLSINSTVSVAAGAVLQLDFAETNVVAGFVTNGFSLPAGVYNVGNVSPFITGSGSLEVVIAGPSGPATLTNSVSGTTLSLSWPDEGWRLQMQTNSLSVGLNTNWTDLTDGSITSTNITVDSTQPTVFYRLVYP